MTRSCSQKVTVDDIRAYGMIPEFIGRLPVIFTLKGLTKEIAGEDPEGAEKRDLSGSIRSCWRWMRSS